MNINKSKERMLELVGILNEANYSYYVLDKPSMTDKKYDKFYSELETLEKQFGTLENSPTRFVGCSVIRGFNKIERTTPLLSLMKVKTLDEVYDFIKKYGQSILSWKLDGLTIELTYRNGVLIKGATRGNGYIGEDITHNVLVMDSIPKYIPYKKEIVIVGEGLITFKDFERINETLDEDEKYSNARNLASGSIRQLDSSVCKERNVRFIAHAIRDDYNINDCDKESHQLHYLSDWGFDVVERTIVNDALDKAERFIDDLALKIPSLEYPIDGVVIKVNSLSKRKELGYNAKTPKYGIAYKYEDEEYETRLTEIEYNVSKSGRVNPIALFEPIDIDGSIVSYATLNNLSYMLDLQLGIGDTLLVKKANMVIPNIVDNLDRSNTYKYIRRCPVCGQKLVILRKESKFLYCTNSKCLGKAISKLEHFCCRGAYNIVGMSSATIEKLWNMNYVRSYHDIFAFAENEEAINELMDEPGFGKKSVVKLVKSIENSKEVTLPIFLYGLNINHLGWERCCDLAEALDYDINKILDWKNNKDVMIGIDGFGDAVYNSVNRYLGSKSNMEEINMLLDYVTIIEPEEQEVVSDSLEGYVVCLTGKYNGMSRDEFAYLVQSNGGIFNKDVTKDVNLLVIGDKPGKGKVDEASAKGVKTIDNSGFSKLIG